jgi:sorbitol/mannitol transport system permease protein
MAIMRSVTGECTGVPSAASSAPEDSAQVPRSRSRRRSAGLAESYTVDPPCSHSPMPTTALVTASNIVKVRATSGWLWTPFMMLILLAGLQSRPLDVIEAAKLDGATSWQIFRYMTFPHLRQCLELAGLLGAIYVVQNFDAVLTLTSGGLGTANLPFMIYQTFYNAQDYGRASAAGIIVVLGTIIIATFALRTVSTLFHEESK